MSSKKNQDGDERFLRVQKDPRFWEMPERERKIKIDKRFKSMFHDKRFKVTYTVDKRGRPINHTSTEDLKRFYKLSDSEEEHATEEKAERKKKKKQAKQKLEKAETEGKTGKSPSGGGKAAGDTERGVRVVGEDDEEEVDLRDRSTDNSEEEVAAADEGEVSSGSDEDALDSDEDSDSGPDLARGKGNVETSSDEDDEDDVEAFLRQEEEQIEHDWGELSKDARRSDEVSARLAVCNMDWQRIKAVDLLALFRSFTPNGGAVLSVKIYPSDFGKERLKLEETQGPLELKALPDDSEDDTEEERLHREKLRDHQFKRLKYYYAVVECDSADTAAKIYEDCDGYEYETSCSMLDLRFIPDDVMFDEEPKDAASDVNLSSYTPNLFTSSASASSKAKLTWDETDHERVTALNRKFNKDELLEMDFNAYLASSSEEEEEDATEDKATGGAVEQEVKKRSEEQISKYRELLKGIQDKDKRLQEDKDMEVTWVPGLKEATEQLVRKKLEGKDKLTPWEGYLQKKKEKKKLKKNQRKLRPGEDELSDDEFPPDVDLSDPFFSEELGADLKKKRKKTMTGEEERTAEEEEELQRQKAEMVLLMDDDADEAKHKHFNYDKIVEQHNLSKRKKKQLLKKSEELLDDDFQVDVKDPRFQAMFTSHLYNLDPSHPSYKKTRATESILAEKQRRREAEQQVAPGGSKQEAAGRKRENDGDPDTKKPMEPSLSLLIKSIKSKTGQFQARKKQKLNQL
ncbi:ESF1 homolog [Betta splendens]|uniref:ESF1 homolog n=1 Tax=Betta splendens TaxID=158456 RepID=A0A6P7MU24_BETSP|nr:ESF1 homolog [Betta splendens]